MSIRSVSSAKETSGWMSANSSRAPPSASRLARCSTSPSSSARIRGQCGSSARCQYYGPWLERFPERAARVFAAIAHARSGGVAYHCGIGRDRTGLVTLLVLRVAGVPPKAVAEDYALSTDRVPVLLERLGAPEQTADLEAFYAEHATTPAEVLTGVLTGFDAEGYLRGAGLGPGDLAALRTRMLVQPPPLG